MKMKKIIWSLLLFPYWLLAQQYTVTFNVDMSVKIAESTFGNGDSVYVRGSFNGWGTTIMHDNDGDAVYTVAVSGLNGNETVNYKFFHTPDVWESDPNRELIVTSDTSVTDYFDRDSIINNSFYTVTFQVDMSIKQQEGSFNPNTSNVYLRADFNGWGLDNMMEDSDGDLIYETIIPSLRDGDYVFKFFHDNPDVWEGDPLRKISVTNDMIYFDYFDRDSVVFDSSGYSITFLCDMNVKNSEGQFNPNNSDVYVRGSFNGWSTTNMLEDTDGDLVYETTVTDIPSGVVEFKYYYDNPATWESDPNREIYLTGDLTYRDYFDRDSLVGETYTVTFQCDMSVKATKGEFNPASSQVYVRGDFNGWGMTVMDDPDGDLLYEAVLNNMLEGTHYFKYFYNNPDTWEMDPNREIYLTSDMIYRDYFDRDSVVLRCGDADNDGTVLAYDAALTLQHTVALITLSPEGQQNADVDMDGFVRAFDAALILRHIISLPEPVETCFDQGIPKQTIPDIENIDFEVLAQSIEELKDKNRIILAFDGFTQKDGVISLEMEIETDNGVEISFTKYTSESISVINKTSENNYKIAVASGNSIDAKQLKLALDIPKDINGSIKIQNVRINNIAKKNINIPDLVNSLNVTEYDLVGNYPNPFNPTTNIIFQTPEKQIVKLTVYDILGRKVKELANREFMKGRHKVEWNGTNSAGNKLSSGNYIVVMQAGNFSKTIKINLLK